MGLPWARKKLKHIAPPMRIVSAASRKRSISATLSDTFAPPSTTTSGRSGDSTIAAQRGDLALQQQARPPTGRCSATPAVLAWARWAAPKASFT